MSVLIFAESENGTLKKSALELASYAKSISDILDTSVTALAINANDGNRLSAFGVSKVLNVKDNRLSDFDAKAYSKVLEKSILKEKANVVIVCSSSDSKALAPVLATNLDAGYLSNIMALPESISPFVVKRSTFSNKAFELSQIHSEIKVLGLFNNVFGLKECLVDIQEEDFSPQLTDDDFSIKVEDKQKVIDKVSIADAEIVVSGGRGLKGPENWNIIENLAEVLGAATACSKPVSDMGWRPHSEHVGQTGKPVSSKLYIAIGISGAIQHIAGISTSKIKVVINTDPQAPFFKVADYGVIGDAFDIVPKLIEKIESFKTNN